MLKALLPVDGSDNALRAVRHVIALVKDREPMEIFLLNVQERADAMEIRRFYTPQEIEAMQVLHGGESLEGARKLLDEAGVAYHTQVLVGDVAQSIARHATEQGCDKIIMGSHGRGALAGLLLGSVATKVIHLAHIPVTLVK
ncbi:MAG: universal stress protein [Betaproteobacteria bacterium]|nr:universal stress protein [Betaproteobacteria bacterium]